MATKLDPFIERLTHLKQTDPVWATENTPYGQVLKVLQEKRIGSLMLCRDGKVTGIFTERDVMNKCLLEEIDPKLPISELMTHNPITISPESTIGDAIALMHRKRIRNLPMVDTEGRLVGLLTVGRLIRYLASVFPAEVMNLPPKPSQVTEEVEGA